jgi:glycosyltransferase involved in cell wall biosynthesis/SAM-dependent methyltransferase
MIVFEPYHTKPVVSVIITCFNQGHFLAEAINSVLKQTYGRLEIIVIDDGSWDNTRDVASAFQQVKYIHKPNSGLPAARNTGIAESKGKYVVFLDADDWLYGKAVETNLGYMQANPNCAFVSGWHDKVDEWNYPIKNDAQIVVSERHYQQLLHGNYIGMHACVMYQRWVFDEFKFDTTLDACEDYDLYFKIARKYPVFNHSEKLAAYRIHGKNMSSRIPFMLKNVLKVLDRQIPSLKSAEERSALREGKRIWKHYYAHKLFHTLLEKIGHEPEWPTYEELLVLLKYYTLGFIRYVRAKGKTSLKQNLKTHLPDPILKSLFFAGIYKHYTPRPGHVEPGDFNRVTPFSYEFGFDRGGAIDRFYIENFLERNRKAIAGTVLEIGDNEYTMRFGGEKVSQSDVLHIDNRNHKATYIGDITDVPQIPSGRFDCIIFTQTLHLIYDFKSALQTCYRILKPGGCLLLTVPGISHIDHGEWKDYWLWSFTDKSIKRLLNETFQGNNVEVASYGNVYVAAAFLYGMGLPETRKDFLVRHDPSYQVIISAKATKS